jgi:hypothetical protein
MAKPIVILTNVANPDAPTGMFIDANRIISWSKVGEHTELSVEGVPFPVPVSESPEDVLAKIQEATK